MSKSNAAERAGFQTACSVIELGCGTGRLAARLLEELLPDDSRHLGLDISETMIDLAQGRVAPWVNRCEGVTCDADNPCTRDDCTAETGCSFFAVSGPCEDGSFCTVGDSCAAGACASGAPLSCDDQSSCTSDACHPLIGCTYANLCHIRATCIAGACECMTGYVGDGYECAPAPAVCGDGACAGVETQVTCPADCDCDVVVIVDEALASVLANSLRTYLTDLGAEGLRGTVESWAPGTVEELKSFIFARVDKYGAEGVFLIGNMPAAWYEQTAFDQHEEFPMDLYLQDRDAVWGDADGDGTYDSHSDLDLDIYLSRLQTIPDPEECQSSPNFPTCPSTYEPGGALYASEACIEHCPSGFAKRSGSPDVDCCGPFFLKRYFDRLHQYRILGSLVNESALVFTDDTWNAWGQPFYLDTLYSTVHVVKELSDTTKEKYVEMLCGEGTDFGLAIVGSTKAGGIWRPEILHLNLAQGVPWGEAYRLWYNNYGYTDDEWHLGMVLFGDPLLTLFGDVTGLMKLSQQEAPSSEDIEALRQSMIDRPQLEELDTFEEYRESNPEFFT